MSKKLTHEEFACRVKEKHGDSIEIIEKYVNDATKIIFKHKCGHIWSARPHDIMRGVGCPKCGGSVKLTHKEYLTRVDKLHHGDIKVIGSYVNNATPILHQHKCGYEWMIRPREIKKIKRCPKCSGKDRTTEDYKELVRQKHNGEIEVLGEFTNTKTKILHRHNICNFEWLTTPGNILAGRGCPKCTHHLSLAHEEFCEKIFEIFGPSAKVLGTFTKANVRILIRYECGHEREVLSYDLLNGHGCNICKNRKTHEQYTDELFEKRNGEYSIVGDYTNSYTKTLHRHNECGRYWLVRPGALLASETSCYHCADTTRSHAEYIKLVKEKHGESIKVIGKYQSLTFKILHEHSCGNRWLAEPKRIINGQSCPTCFKAIKKTTKEYVRELEEKFNGEFSALEAYKNAQTKILHRHNKCGTEWMVKPNSLLTESGGCPTCNESKGEKLIKEILSSKNIHYERQYKLKGCKIKRIMPFDFAIFGHDKKLAYLIEWDGRQHHEPVKAFGGEDEFKQIQLRDSIKNKYCSDHNIPLLRLPYWLTEEEVKSKIDEMLIKTRTSSKVEAAN